LNILRSDGCEPVRWLAPGSDVRALAVPIKKIVCWPHLITWHWDLLDYSLRPIKSAILVFLEQINSGVKRL
jgi:hypothetical protein